MNAGTKVGGFLAGLVVMGAVGAGVGSLAGPIDTEPTDHDAPAEHGDTTEHGGATDDTPAPDGHAGHEGDETGATDGDATTPDAAPEPATGTSATQDGYRLALDPTEDEIRFEVLDPEGAPVVETEILHEKPLHLIVVGRDLVGYAHVHPEVDADGTWSVAHPDLAPGSYRVVADLQPVGGPELALAGDLTVPGAVTPVAVPEPSTTATAGDLTVALDGTPAVGDVELAFTVTRAGQPVEPEPYLGARGHLVAFRADDLAYLHVHPHDGDEGPVEFTASFATPGTYRLFLDLQVDGVVRTAAFTVVVPGPGGDTDTLTPDDAPATDPEPEEGADHEH
ncbi:MAG TPA: hypothetical protein VK507_08560 [Iamia sp.]|nr:hypothetical protein [Iamia sp.]